MILLAAAVADFYQPEANMATEKIQSRAHRGLRLDLHNTPKMLGCIKGAWGAKLATVISFKLETNPNILEAKAAGAIKNYGVEAVCANMLESYRRTVTIVRRVAASLPGIRLGEAPVARSS